MQDKILKNTEVYPFHMPGHKRNKNFISENLLDFDMTEIFGLDNLHNPRGIIKEAQENCAKIFGSKQSFFVVNGASSAVMAAIFSVCNENDGIIVQRSSHKSLYNALELNGAVPYYLYGKNFHEINYGINFEELENLLQMDVKAIFVTSPNYEGFALDIKKIAEIVHSYGKILIVDEAHGSHFVFHEKFPPSAIKSGADIVINSLHKTLPCLTQSAILHINNDLIDIERVKKYLSIFQTSSPSYILMSTMDKTLKKVSVPEFFNKYVEKIETVRTKLSLNQVFMLINKSDLLLNLDITKLTFLINTDSNIDIERILRVHYNIQIEMRGMNHFMALSTIADTNVGFQMLINALVELENKFKYKKLETKTERTVKLETAVSIKKAVASPKKLLNLQNSLGKISADYIIPYPPGIPVIVPGEIISGEIINFLSYYLQAHVEIIGFRQNNIFVVDK